MIKVSPASVGRVLKEYIGNLAAIQPNSRLYLVNVMIVGVAMGVFRLLFNFFVLSLGFDNSILGHLTTVSSFTALIFALPMGHLVDRIGRKGSLVLSGVFLFLAVLIMVLLPSMGILFVCNFIFGLAQSLGGVTMAPFLMENSSEKERTYLFSFVSGFQMVSGSIGNWIGGYMPTWIAAARGVDPEHTTAYAGSLLIVAITGAVAVIPLLMLKSPKTTYSKRDAFTPLVYVKKYPKTLGRLILPILLTSIGAGLVMPFQNVFFKDVHHASDPLIGTIFAWGSLAMGIGLLIAPPLAARLGKIELVVITQGLSIPFLILLGFAPWLSISVIAYYVRVALMNMSTPVYQTFVMEQVEPEARATVATLNSMSWNFGWTFSPMISGVIQVSSGFGLPFLGTIVFYIIAVYLYWLFFWKGRSKPTSVALPEATTGD